MNKMVTATSTTSQTSFDQVMEQLDKLSQNSKSLVEPTKTLDEKIADFRTLCSDVDNVINSIHTASDGLQGAEEACQTCSAFPTVGTVARQCNKVISPANKSLATVSKELQVFQTSVLEPTLKTTITAQRGIKVTQQTLNFMSVQLPGYTTTLRMLNDLVKIANVLLKTFPDATCHKKLEKVIATYQNIREQVDKVLQPILTHLNVLLNIIKNTIQSLETANSALKDANKISIDSSFTKPLSEVTNVMKKIHDGLGPLSKALDAAEKIGGACVEKVVESILDSTHTSGLIHTIESPMGKAVNKFLGPVEDIPKNLKKQIHTGLVPAELINAPNSLKDMVKEFDAVMKKYLINSDDQKKKYINELLSAFGDIKTGGDLPPIEFAPAQLNNTANIPMTEIYYSSVESAFSEPKEIATMSRFSVATPLPKETDSTGFGKLAKQANDIGKAYEDLAKRCISLTSEKVRIHQISSLPKDFSQQVSDIQQIMHFMKTAVTFLHSLTTRANVNNILDNVLNIANQQLSACDNISGKMATLHTNIEAVTKSTADIVHVVSSYSTLDNAASDLARINPYVLGIQNTQQRVNENYPEIREELHAMLESNAKDAGQALSSLETHRTTINTKISDLDGHLKNYRESLKSVADNMQLISAKNMPMYNQLALQLGKLVAIFDPLSDLLSIEPNLCSANSTIQQGRDHATKLAESESNAITQKIEDTLQELIEKLLPLSKLEEAIDDANNKTQQDLANQISQSIREIRSATGELSAELQEMSDAHIMPMFGFGSITHWVKHHVIDPVESSFDKALHGLSKTFKALLKGLCSI